jgi:hypothetical protein
MWCVGLERLEGRKERRGWISLVESSWLRVKVEFGWGKWGRKGRKESNCLPVIPDCMVDCEDCGGES